MKNAMQSKAGKWTIGVVAAALLTTVASKVMRMRNQHKSSREMTP